MKGGFRWGLAVLLLVAHAAEPACRVACSSDAEARGRQLLREGLHVNPPLHHSRSLLKAVSRRLRIQPAQAEEADEGREGSGSQKVRRSVRVKALFHSKKRASADSKEKAVVPALGTAPLSEEGAISEGTAAQQPDQWRDLSPEERIAAALEEKALAAEDGPQQDGPEQEKHAKPSQQEDAELPGEVANGNGEESAKPGDDDDLQFSLDSILRRYNVKGTRPAPEKDPITDAEETADEGNVKPAEVAEPEGAAGNDVPKTAAEEGTPEEKEAETDEQQLQGGKLDHDEHRSSWLTTWLQDNSKKSNGLQDAAKADYTLNSLLAVLAMGDVRSMMAAPCSNIDWLEPVLKSVTEHRRDFSFTCVDEDVEALRATFSSELAVSFIELDFTEGGDLPEAHLLFSQDVLRDLPLKTVVRVLESFARSGAELVLLGSTTQTRAMRAGGKPVELNLQQEPFLLDQPLLVFGENVPGAPEQQLLLFSGAYLRTLQWADMRARVKEFVAAQRRI